MFDLAAFWATVAALLSRTLGIAEVVGAVFKGVRDGADVAQMELREKLARGLARPMMKLAWAYAIGMALAMGFLFNLTESKHYLTGDFVTTCVIVLIALVAPLLIVWRETRRVLAHDESPLDVNYSACAGSLIIGSITASVILSLFAISLNSNLLWLVSMAVRYLMLGVCTVALMIAAWIVRNTGSFLEKALELFFVIFAPILPGITYENVRDKLFPHGLEFIDEEELAAKITAITGVLVGFLLPFDLVVLSAPYYSVALAFGLGYLVKVFAARIAIAAGREELVDASLKRLSGILFTYFPWIAAFTSCAGRVIYAWMPAPFDASAIWFRRLFHGEAHLVGWHPWYVNLGILGVALVVLLIGVGLAELGASKKWKAISIGIPVLLCLWPVGSLLQNLGVWNGTLGAVSPKTPEQAIVVTNAVSGTGDVPALIKVGKNYAVLGWSTDKKADCLLEIIEVTSQKEDYEHREYVRGTRLQARVDIEGKLHQATLDGLEHGVNVKYRLHCSIAEEKYRGLTTQTHEYEYVHDSLAKPETEIVITNAVSGTGDVPALIKVGKDYAVLGWFTDKKADCLLEIIEVTSQKEDYEHRKYVRGTRLQARVDTKGKQQATLDGLEDRVKVKYRIYCSIAEGNYRGLTTQTRGYEYVHDSLAKPETPPESEPAAPVASDKAGGEKSEAADDGSNAKAESKSAPLPAPKVAQAGMERKKRFRRTPEERAEDARLRQRMNASVDAL